MLPVSRFVPVVTPEPAEAATVSSTVSIRGAGSQSDHRVELKIRDAEGRVVSRAAQDVPVAAGGSSHTIELPAIEDPQLWSPASPSLYTLEATLVDADGRSVHEAADRFGLRWYEFAPDGAFVLNGERLLLRGTHRHEEHAAYGAAMPDELHVRACQWNQPMPGRNIVRSPEPQLRDTIGRNLQRHREHLPKWFVQRGCCRMPGDVF